MDPARAFWRASTDGYLVWVAEDSIGVPGFECVLDIVTPIEVLAEFIANELGPWQRIEGQRTYLGYASYPAVCSVKQTLVKIGSARSTQGASMPPYYGTGTWGMRPLGNQGNHPLR